MTFHHKKRVQKHNFSVEVLSELSNQASQVLTSMQVALGFVIGDAMSRSYLSSCAMTCRMKQPDRTSC